MYEGETLANVKTKVNGTNVVYEKQKVSMKINYCFIKTKNYKKLNYLTIYNNSIFSNNNSIFK